MIICLLWMVTTLVGYAQKRETIKDSSTHAIKLLATGKKDSILLRWAPLDELTWQLGNKYGYTVERFTIARDGKMITDAEKKGERLVTLTPLPENSWQPVIAADQRAEVVQKILYNKDFDKTSAEGGPENFLQKKQELEMRFSLALFTCDVSPVTARAAGLFFVDKQVRTNEKYVYKISLASLPAGTKVEPGVALVSPTETMLLPRPTDVTAVFSDSIIKLTWPTVLHTGIYAAYYIEKSSDGKKFVSATGGLPFVYASQEGISDNAYFTDSLADNEHTWYYRIKGLTPFGETGPYSALIQGKGRPAYSILPVIEKGENLGNRQVQLQWRFPAEGTKELTGFSILRAAKPDGPYTEITKQPLAKGKLTFTDNAPLLTNYYKVKAIGKGPEMVALSFPYLVVLEDDKNPEMPQAIQGVSNDSGVVTLHWKANTESDLLGYRVFRANELKEEFIDITNRVIADTTYTDTIAINTLTPAIYYKIVAVDKRFNTSPYSLPLRVKRPDKIPPAAPLFTQAGMVDSLIQLTWIPSVSEDVAAYKLNRLNTTTAENKTVLAWNKQNKEYTSYTDTGARQGYRYKYELEAVDSAGNKAVAHSGTIFYETGLRAAVSNLTAAIDKEKKLIRLRWSYNEAGVKKYYIYRAKNSEPMLLMETVPLGVTTFEDKNVMIGTSYTYKVKAVMEGGVSSKLGKGIEVKF